MRARSKRWPRMLHADVYMRTVEMFKVRMQGQYGSPGDKRLRAVVSEMWRDWGFRKGIMRGYWVLQSSPTHRMLAEDV